MITIRGSKDYLVALESVAMTDIVMNMFIFFFISFSLLYTFNVVKPSKIKINMPKASSAVALEGSEKTILTIKRSGEYFINDEMIKVSNLKGVLEEKLKEDHDMAVLLKVDAMARFEFVVKALDAINDLDIKKVSVAAVK